MAAAGTPGLPEAPPTWRITRLCHHGGPSLSSGRLARRQYQFDTRVPGTRFLRSSAWRASHSLPGSISTRKSDCPAAWSRHGHAVAIQHAIVGQRRHARARRDDAGEIERIGGAQRDEVAAALPAGGSRASRTPHRATRIARRSCPRRSGRRGFFPAPRAGGTPAAAHARAAASRPRARAPAEHHAVAAQQDLRHLFERRASSSLAGGGPCGSGSSVRRLRARTARRAGGARRAGASCRWESAARAGR